MYVVKHSVENWWIANRNGDPRRTLKEDNARIYSTKKGANMAITYFKKNYSHIRNMDLVILPLRIQPMPYE